MSERHPEYKVVSFLDVDQLLSFAKNEMQSLEEEIKEEKRVEKEIKEFILDIEKHSGHKIHYIGHEKRYGKHLIRFLFKDGGFLEVLVDKPLALNAHFISERQAKRFLLGLKKALNKKLPDHPVKNMFIDSIKVEDGFKDEVISLDKWSRIHKLTIRKTIATSVVVLLIFLLIEATENYLEEAARTVFHIESIVVSIISALLIALFFEPIKEKIDQILGKLID